MSESGPIDLKFIVPERNSVSGCGRREMDENTLRGPPPHFWGNPAAQIAIMSLMRSIHSLKE